MACSLMCSDVAWKQLFRKLSQRKACRHVIFSAFRYIIVTLNRAGPFQKCVWANSSPAVIQVSTLRYRLDYTVMSPLQIKDFMTTEMAFLVAQMRPFMDTEQEGFFAPSPVGIPILQNHHHQENDLTCTTIGQQLRMATGGIYNRQMRLVLLMQWMDQHRDPLERARCADVITQVLNLPFVYQNRCFALDPAKGAWVVAGTEVIDSILREAGDLDIETASVERQTEKKKKSTAVKKKTRKFQDPNIDAGRYWRKSWKTYMDRVRRLMVSP